MFSDEDGTNDGGGKIGRNKKTNFSEMRP